MTGDRREFFGSGNIGKPECLRKEKLSGMVGIGFDPCAAIQVNISLNPMEGKDIIFTLGAAGKIGEVDQNLHISTEIFRKQKGLWLPLKSSGKEGLKLCRSRHLTILWTFC